MLFSYRLLGREVDNLELHRSAVSARRQSGMKRARGSQRARCTYQGNNLTNGTVLPVEIRDRVRDATGFYRCRRRISISRAVGRRPLAVRLRGMMFVSRGIDPPFSLSGRARGISD